MEHPLLPKAIPTPTNHPPIMVPNSANTSPSTLTLLIRFVAFLSLAAVSVWANYEAAKGFEITILSADRNTVAGRCFNLMFVSNGRAARFVLNSSDFIERRLYPSELYPKKSVRHVTLLLADQELSEVVAVIPGRGSGDFVIHVSPGVVSEADVKMAVASAVQRAMAQVWLWNGQGRAPRSLLNAMGEYLTMAARLVHRSKRNNFSITPNTSCWDDSSYFDDARFLHYCEEQKQGFVARLNRAMVEDWNEHMPDRALGLQSRKLCSAFLVLARQQGVPSGSASAFPYI